MSRARCPLLREELDEYAFETGGTELPTACVIEWLAEWCRDVRRRQTGLMLLTAHRAKGLEFGHVAVLNPALLRRGATQLPAPAAELAHEAIAASSPGDALELGREADKWVLFAPDRR